MIILLIGATFAIILFQFFSVSYSFQGLNKSIIFAPIEMMFSDVNVGIDGAVIKQEDVMKHLDEYYGKYLPRYCHTYETSYYFYNNGNSICIGNLCDGVEVTVNATVNLNILYTRTMYYEINTGIKHG